MNLSIKDSKKIIGKTMNKMEDGKLSIESPRLLYFNKMHPTLGKRQKLFFEATIVKIC